MNTEADIDELIGKYFSGEALPEEAMHLEDWKNLNEENHLYFLQSEKIFSSSTHKADSVDAWNKVSSKINPSAKRIPIRSLIAIGALLDLFVPSTFV